MLTKKTLYLSFLSLIITTFAFGETISLSTYYPAPFGAYDQLRLVPRNAPPTCSSTLEGLMFYDNTLNALNICQDDENWGLLGGVWTQDTVNDYIFPTDTATNPNLFVGIGTTTPTSKLHIADSVLGGYVELRLHNTADQSSSRIVFSETTQGNNFEIRYHSDKPSNDNWLEFWTTKGTRSFVPIMTIQRDYDLTDPHYGGVTIGPPTILYNPSAKLEVRNAGPEDILNLFDDTTEVLTVEDGGNVGIGTEYPLEKLHIAGNGKMLMGDTIISPGGKLRVNLAEGESETQAIKTMVTRQSGRNFAVNGTAIGTGADYNIGLIGWAENAVDDKNWGLLVSKGYGIFRDSVRIGPDEEVPDANLHVADDVPGGYAELRLQNIASQSSSRLIFSEGTQGNNFEMRYNSAPGNRNFFEFWGPVFGDRTTIPLMTLQRDYEPSASEYGGLTIGPPSINYDTSAKLEVRNAGTEDILNLFDDTTEVLTVVDGGNVGIGTDSPLGNLDIADAGTAQALIRSTTTDGDASLRFEEGEGSSRYGVELYYTGSGTVQGLSFRDITSGVEFMTMKRPSNSGSTPAKIGIGDTTPDVELDVVGDINYTGSITDVSDKRLKENIKPIDDPIQKLIGIEGVYFNMIGTEQIELGVIAQDVQRVLPEAVRVIDEENGYLGVSYPSLIPVLIESIKAQQKEIEKLKTENTLLNDRLIILEEK